MYPIFTSAYLFSRLSRAISYLIDNPIYPFFLVYDYILSNVSTNVFKLICRFQRVSLGKSPYVYGIPVIVKRPFSTISIGSNFQIISSPPKWFSFLF